MRALGVSNKSEFRPADFIFPISTCIGTPTCGINSDHILSDEIILI